MYASSYFFIIFWKIKEFFRKVYFKIRDNICQNYETYLVLRASTINADKIVYQKFSTWDASLSTPDLSQGKYFCNTEIVKHFCNKDIIQKCMTT